MIQDLRSAIYERVAPSERRKTNEIPAQRVCKLPISRIFLRHNSCLITDSRGYEIMALRRADDGNGAELVKAPSNSFFSPSLALCFT